MPLYLKNNPFMKPLLGNFNLLTDYGCDLILHRGTLKTLKLFAKTALKAELLLSVFYLIFVLGDSVPYYLESTTGENLCREGKPEDAEPHLQRALSYSHNWVYQDKRTLRALCNIAELNHRRGRYESAIIYSLQAYELAQRKYPDKIEYVLSINNLAAIYRDAGEEEKSECYFLQALTLCDELSRKCPAERWRKIDIITNLAKLHINQGKLAQAQKELTNCLATFVPIAGPQDIALGPVYEGLGKVYLAGNRLGEAKLSYEKALKIDENFFGHVSEIVSNDYDNLAETLISMNRLAEAEQCFWTAIRIRVSIYGKKHHLMGLCNYNIAKIRFKQKRFDEALWLAEHALTFTHQHSEGGSRRVKDLISRCRLAKEGQILSSLPPRS